MPVSLGSGTPTLSIGAGSYVATPVTSAAWTISGSNLAMLIAIGVDNTATVSAVTWSLGGGTPVQVASISSDVPATHIEIWAIPAPTAGTGTYTVTLSVATDYKITASYFINTDQTTPCPLADIWTDTSTSASLASSVANLASNDACYGCLAAPESDNDAETASPTQTYQDSSLSLGFVVGYGLGITQITTGAFQIGTGLARAAVRIVAVFEVVGDPFKLDTYPNPIVKDYHSSLRTHTNPANDKFVGQDRMLGFGNHGLTYDWPNPTRKHYPVDLRTWASNSLENTLLPGKTFVPIEWPNPTPRTYPLSLRTWTSYFTFDETPAFFQTSWPNPVGQTFRSDYRTWSSPSLSLLTANPIPFNISEWPNPTPKLYAATFRTYIQSSITTIVGASPFNQTSWPNPLRREYPLSLRTWIAGVLSTTPFAQLNWPNPNPKLYPADLRTWLQNGIQQNESHLLFPEILIRQLEWPNPRYKLYALDLRTFLEGRVLVPIEFLAATAPCEVFYVLVDEDMQVVSDNDIIVPTC